MSTAIKRAKPLQFVWLDRRVALRLKLPITERGFLQPECRNRCSRQTAINVRHSDEPWHRANP
jgi:hypothetical protein